MVFYCVLGVVHPTSYEYHNVHEEQQQQHHPDTHSNEEIVYGQPHHTENFGHQAENYPDDKHTQIILPQKNPTPYQSDEHYDHEDQQQHYLAPAQVNTYRAPLVYHKYEQYYNDDQGDSSQYAGSAGSLNTYIIFFAETFNRINIQK